MPSTDIDGTPILMFGAHEIEYLAELMDDASIGISNPIFGRPTKPTQTSTYKKMQRFLNDHDVICWLDDFNEEVADEMYEEMIEDLKARGVYDGED